VKMEMIESYAKILRKAFKWVFQWMRLKILFN
jgi:hypothetical protein